MGIRARWSEACKRIKDEEAADTAGQVPLKPWQRDQVMARGHRNENERRRLNKTLAVDLYGDAYDGLAVGRKVKTTRRHLFSSLAEEVINPDRVKALMEDPSVGILKPPNSDETRQRHTNFFLRSR